MDALEAHKKSLIFWSGLRANPEMSKAQWAKANLSQADFDYIKGNSFCWLCKVNTACEKCALASRGEDRHTCESNGQPYDLWKSASNERDLIACTRYADRICRRIEAWIINNRGEAMKYFVMNTEDNEVEECDDRAEVETYINDLIEDDSDNYSLSDFQVIKGTEIQLESNGVKLEEEDDE